MKIYVLGSGGMMGTMFTYYLKDVCCIDRNIFDASKDNIEKLLNVVDITEEICLINFIGCIPQKKHYTDEDYVKINQEFPLILAEFCKKNNFFLIHLSTNCVFSGKKNNYTENDTPDANDIYGITKYKGEPQDYGLTIRASIIGPEKNTSYGLFSWFMSQNETTKGFTNQVWNGVTTLELTKFIVEIIVGGKLSKNKELVHVFSSNSMTKFELLNLFKTIFQKNIIVEPFEQEEKKRFYTLSGKYKRKTIQEQLVDLKSLKLF
jgi:dTDP-4-dehydrorhamnose reductase